METIAESKQFLKKNYDKGCICPACGQFVKLYKRKLNSGMAVTLIHMYNYNAYAWINVKDFLREKKLRNNHDWTLLKYWGILEEKPGKPGHGGKTLGEWRITNKGREFVLNRLSVPKRILIYNSQFQGFDTDITSIINSLGEKFIYRELMNL